jgi:hypothetical protein
VKRLLRRYPVKVAYPFAGVRYILRWYEYNVGRNLIMTKSEDDMVNRFMWRYTVELGIEPKEYLKVTLVSPPEKFKRYYAWRSHKNDFNNFSWLMHWHAAHIKEILGEAPFPFVDCRKYEYKYDDEQEESDPDHSNCKNCTNGVVIGDNAHWLKIYYNRNGCKPTSKKIRPIVAKEADPAKPIYYASEAHGVELQELVSDDGSYTIGLNSSILFFYQLEEELPLPKPIIERIELDKLEKEIKKLEKEESSKRFDFQYLQKVLLEYLEMIK